MATSMFNFWIVLDKYQHYEYLWFVYLSLKCYINFFNFTGITSFFNLLLFVSFSLNLVLLIKVWYLSTVSSNIVSKESLFMNEINEKEIEKRQNSNLLMNRFMNYTDDDFLDHGYSEDCQTSTYSFNSDLTRTYCDHVSSKFDLFQHRLRTTNIMPQLSSQIIQDSISEIAFDETLNLNNEID